MGALQSGFREHYGRFGEGPRAWHGAHAMRMWQQLGAVASHRRQAMAAREFLKQRQILSFWSQDCFQLSQMCSILHFITQIKRVCVNFATLSFHLWCLSCSCSFLPRQSPASGPQPQISVDPLFFLSGTGPNQRSQGKRGKKSLGNYFDYFHE